MLEEILDGPPTGVVIWGCRLQQLLAEPRPHGLGFDPSTLNPSMCADTVDLDLHPLGRAAVVAGPSDLPHSSLFEAKMVDPHAGLQLAAEHPGAFGQRAVGELPGDPAGHDRRLARQLEHAGAVVLAGAGPEVVLPRAVDLLLEAGCDPNVHAAEGYRRSRSEVYRAKVHKCVSSVYSQSSTCGHLSWTFPRARGGI